MADTEVYMNGFMMPERLAGDLRLLAREKRLGSNVDAVMVYLLTRAVDDLNRAGVLPIYLRDDGDEVMPVPAPPGLRDGEIPF